MRMLSNGFPFVQRVQKRLTGDEKSVQFGVRINFLAKEAITCRSS